MWKVTVQILGGKVRHVEMDVGEEGVTVSELKELLEKQLGAPWRYCGLLVDGSSADYLGDERIKGGDVHVIIAVPQIQGARS